MYHPGKIVKILSTQDANIKSHDNTTQALIEMWDENVFTFLIDPQIAKDVKDGDIVLVDYTPLPHASHAPRHVVTKILRGKSASAVWDKYKKYYETRKKTQKQPSVQPPQSEYFG